MMKALSKSGLDTEPLRSAAMCSALARSTAGSGKVKEEVIGRVRNRTEG